MPSSITHALVAQTAQTRLPEEITAIIEEAPEMYFLGAQGADLFFFATKANKQEGNLGKYLHRNSVYELFGAFLGVIRSLSDKTQRHAIAYCLGYVTHYCTDVAFHPCVYRYMEQNAKHKREHQRIENDWDVYFARKLQHAEVENYPFPDLERCDEEALLEVWKGATTTLGLTPMTKSRLRGGLCAFGAYLKFFHCECYSSQKGWAAFDKFFHAHLLSCLFPSKTPDQEIISGKAFERAANPDEFITVRTVDDLFDRAVEESVLRIGLFFDAVHGAPLSKTYFDCHLLTGEHLS